MFHNRLKTILLAIAALGLICGGVFWLAGFADLAAWVWTAGVLPILAALIFDIARSLAKGEIGLDIVAALSMSAALIFGETLAAAVVALMYAGGTFLESFAEGRARREMQSLLSRVARTATLYRDGQFQDVPLEEIIPNDLLLIRQGEVAPVDGTLESAQAMLLICGQRTLLLTAPTRALCAWLRPRKNPKRQWHVWQTSTRCCFWP